MSTFNRHTPKHLKKRYNIERDIKNKYHENDILIPINHLLLNIINIPEILELVLSYLDILNIAQIATTCKSFYLLSKSRLGSFNKHIIPCCFKKCCYQSTASIIRKLLKYKVAIECIKCVKEGTGCLNCLRNEFTNNPSFNPFCLNCQAYGDHCDLHPFNLLNC